MRSKATLMYESSDFPSYLPKLHALYDDLFSGGKGFRFALVSRVAQAVSLGESQTELLGRTIEYIHNASLLHDDLVDRSHLRRNKPAAWLKYTPEYAVLAGDYLLARVMVNLSRNGNLKLIELTSYTISDLLEGEWIQDSLIHDYNVRLEQLDEVHALKTASLFKWCLRAPYLASGVDDPSIHQMLSEIGSIMGLLFQRSDDLLDFDIRNGEGKKPLGDLKSGYLNSAAVFLIEGLETEKRTKFIASSSIEEIKFVLGESYFESRIREFDNINKESLEIALHLLSQLPDLSEKLKELIPVLYWRSMNYQEGQSGVDKEHAGRV